MSATAGSSPPPPPPAGQDPKKGTGHQAVEVKIPRSGHGFFRQLPQWSPGLESNLQELPGYVVKTHGGTAAPWQRVMATEAKSWAQMGAEVYDGVTLEQIDPKTIPGPMSNPSSPTAHGTVGQLTTETILDIERQLEANNDEQYLSFQVIHETTPPVSPSHDNNGNKDKSSLSGSSDASSAGGSVFD